MGPTRTGVKGGKVKSPAPCEACGGYVRHGGDIVVGRKTNGRPRLIHKDPRCKKKWERVKAKRMAKWPELRGKPIPKDEVVIVQVEFDEKAATEALVKRRMLEEAEDRKAAAKAVQPPPQEEAVTTSTGKKIRSKWDPPVEIFRWVEQKFRNNGGQCLSGTGIAWFRQVKEEHPTWLIRPNAPMANEVQFHDLLHAVAHANGFRMSKSRAKDRLEEMYKKDVAQRRPEMNRRDGDNVGTKLYSSEEMKSAVERTAPPKPTVVSSTIGQVIADAVKMKVDNLVKAGKLETLVTVYEILKGEEA